MDKSYLDYYEIGIRAANTSRRIVAAARCPEYMSKAAKESDHSLSAAIDRLGAFNDGVAYEIQRQLRLELK